MRPGPSSLASGGPGFFVHVHGADAPPIPTHAGGNGGRMNDPREDVPTPTGNLPPLREPLTGLSAGVKKV